MIYEESHHSAWQSQVLHGVAFLLLLVKLLCFLQLLSNSNMSPLKWATPTSTARWWVSISTVRAPVHWGNHTNRERCLCASKDSDSGIVPSSKWKVTYAMVPMGTTKLQSIYVKSGKPYMLSVLGFVGHLFAFTMIYLHPCVWQSATNKMEKRNCGCKPWVQT